VRISVGAELHKTTRWSVLAKFDGEFAKSSLDLRRYGNVAVYVVRDVPIFTPPNSTTCPVGDGQISSILAALGRSLREKRPEKPMRAKSIFARTFKLIGSSGPFCKNSSISYFPKLCLRLRIPHRQEGRTRRHERGAGTRWTSWCRLTSGTFYGRRSRVVLARPCRR